MQEQLISERVPTSEVGAHIGEHITVTGWLHSWREMGGVSFLVLRDAWGKGYATEGSIAAIDWAFDQLGWTEVIHSIAPDNAASQSVARRLGSRLIGPGRLPEPFQELPVEIWGQSRDAWRGRRA